LAAGNRGAFDAGSFQPAYALEQRSANRATTISRARMLRIGLLRRFCGDVALGKALGDFA
jgi:hypothetical protein